MDTPNSLLSDTSTPAPPLAGSDLRTRAAQGLYPAQDGPRTDKAPNAAVQELRASQPARVLYDDVSMFGPKKSGSDIKELILAANPAASRESVASDITALASIFTDVGASREDVSLFAGVARALANDPPDEKAVAKSQREAIRDLRAKYGDQFEDAYQAAKALAARDPRLMRLLDRTGIGNHPRVVARLAELGIAQRRAGNLN